MTNERKSFLFGFLLMLGLCVVPLVGDLIISILDTFKKTVWNPVTRGINNFTLEVEHEKDVSDYEKGRTKRSPGHTFIFGANGIDYVLLEDGRKITYEDYKEGRF